MVIYIVEKNEFSSYPAMLKKALLKVGTVSSKGLTLYQIMTTFNMLV